MTSIVQLDENRGDTVDCKNNEDEGGGGGKQAQELLQAESTSPPLTPTKVANQATATDNSAPTSPSIRQQVTSVLWNMRNKLSSSHYIVEQLQQQQQQTRFHGGLRHDEANEDSDEEDEHYEQAVDIFVKHLDQQELERERQRRASLPTDDIELTTLSGVVLRRKQQLQMRYQQHQELDPNRRNVANPRHQDDSEEGCQQAGAQQHLLPPKARPLSISSISSAVSSGSSSSSNSSSSSGIQSSLTRNSSLNYSQEFRKQSYLASIESLDGSANDNGCGQTQMTPSSSSNYVDATSTNDLGSTTTAASSTSMRDPSFKTIESALKNINLTDQFKDLGATRAAVLAAGESQRRNFGAQQSNRISRINRSLHASLRYDKNTAYRIHLMANARLLMTSTQTAGKINPAQLGNQLGGQHQMNPADDDTGLLRPFRRYSSISRNNSSTSSDSGNPRQSFSDVNLLRLRCTCPTTDAGGDLPPVPLPIEPDTSSASLGDRQGGSAPALDNKFPQSSPPKDGGQSVKQKAATLDGAACQRNAATSHQMQPHQHHPDCMYSKSRPRRASARLQQSPSSVSSHSNNSSLFRDDGFEDDLTSTASEHSSTIFHQQRQLNHLQHHDHHRQLFYHQNQNHQLSYQRGHLQEAGLGLLTISQRVVTEIIETERSYVDDLEQIVTGYLCYLRDALEQHKELFSNLEDIHKFNKDFLFQLEECYLNPGAVAACFVENASKFDVYTHYCTMYPEVVSTLTQLMADATTAQVLKERQLELNQSLPLGAYLLKPVQRILKYHILFRSLIKHTADDETVASKDRGLINEAFSVMTNIACHINEMKKKHEHSIRVQELQSLLCGWEGPDLTTLGELILEDNFKLYNRPRSSRHLLLFDNVLLITKKKRDGSLCYKSHIACSNLMLIETIEGQPLVFNTVPFDNPKALCAFQADNLDKKRDWCLQMKEVIIKSFEVKIPVHVKDLLMSLTKGSITGGCSNGSSSSVSSSKKSVASETSKTCIHAPKYLEKKRIRQEKKKQ